jgi:predicted ArsR family transcriptional regulator
MADQPLCPVVLSLLASGPRRPDEVARRLALGYGVAGATLERLRVAGLVRERPGGGRAGRADRAYAITARGRSELVMQRMLAALVAGVRSPRALAAPRGGR